jgi:hypothetical protein
MRVASALIAGCLAVSIGACDKTEPAAVAPAAVEAPAPASEPQPVATPAPDMRMAAMQLSCGGETFRVAFEDGRAVVVNADGSNTELARLEPSPDAAPGVTTYTNGMMTFTKEGGRDTATVIRYAKGRMAFQDCAIAQN